MNTTKIKGDEQTVKRIMEAKPGDPCVYVNMEAVMHLPDDVEPVPVVVKFDPLKDFEDIGDEGKPSFYPIPKLMYLIAQERGISQIGNTITETLYEEVNISEQEMSPVPVIMKMKVGYSCTKTGATLGDDNTQIVRTHSKSFNAWDKCRKAWSTEEMYTEGYSKLSKYPNKYDTKWKRRNHFQKMLQHAWSVVDTQSWLKCIRDCACMLTGYQMDQIKEGKFYWIKIRRSEAIRKLETAARLDCIRNGGGAPALTQQAKPQIEEKPIIQIEEKPLFTDFESSPEPEPVKGKESEKETTQRDKLIMTFQYYIEKGLIPNKNDEWLIAIKKMLSWLEKNKDAEMQTAKFKSSVDNLKMLEKSIPAEGRLNHGLY